MAMHEHIGEMFHPPAPPEAITGTSTASATRRVSSRSYPACVPSRSIEVSRISPRAERCRGRGHPTASSSVGFRPPWVYTASEAPDLGQAGVDCDDDALVAKTTRRLPHQLGILDGGGIETDLVRASVEHRADIIYGA